MPRGPGPVWYPARGGVTGLDWSWLDSGPPCGCRGATQACPPGGWAFPDCRALGIRILAKAPGRLTAAHAMTRSGTHAGNARRYCVLLVCVEGKARRDPFCARLSSRTRIDAERFLYAVCTGAPRRQPRAGLCRIIDRATRTGSRTVSAHETRRATVRKRTKGAATPLLR